mmetsp:Transcript_85523/g.149391  ORF Transcript_85523/g.149391 Transcript_85523/m.149391 type:complete len:557 (-) Transcript_85523:172-1842(-)
MSLPPASLLVSQDSLKAGKGHRNDDGETNSPQVPVWQRYLEEADFRIAVDITMSYLDPLGASIGRTAWRGQGKLKPHTVQSTSTSTPSLAQWGRDLLTQLRNVKQAILQSIQNGQISSSQAYRQYCQEVHVAALALDQAGDTELLRSSEYLNTWQTRFLTSLLKAQGGGGQPVKATFVWFSHHLLHHFMPGARSMPPEELTASSEGMWDAMLLEGQRGLQALSQRAFQTYLWDLMETLCDTRTESESAQLLNAIFQRLFTSENIAALRELQQARPIQVPCQPADPAPTNVVLPTYGRCLRDVNPFLASNVGTQAKRVLQALTRPQSGIVDVAELCQSLDSSPPGSPAVSKKNDRLRSSLPTSPLGATCESLPEFQTPKAFQMHAAFPRRVRRPANESGTVPPKKGGRKAADRSSSRTPPRTCLRDSVALRAVPMVGRENNALERLLLERKERDLNILMHTGPRPGPYTPKREPELLKQYSLSEITSFVQQRCFTPPVHMSESCVAQDERHLSTALNSTDEEATTAAHSPGPQFHKGRTRAWCPPKVSSLQGKYQIH